MTRLTERSSIGAGTVYLNGANQDALQKLAAYEDTGLDPEQILTLADRLRDAERELITLELQLEALGREMEVLHA